jgi:hypothetical protein
LCEYGKKPLEKKTENGGEKEKMNAKYKKSLKIVSLLITAIIIGTVSATTYSYMYLNGSVIIGTQQLIWLTGADSPGGTVIAGGTVTLPLTVQPGVDQNFTEALFLKNNETSTNHALTINVTTALSNSDFDTANAYIFTNSSGSWVYVDTLSLMTLSDGYSGTLNAGYYYRLTFEIQAKTTASGTKSFVLLVTYS